MQSKSNRVRGHDRPGRSFALLLMGVFVMLAACSDDSLMDLGGRSSDWIGEVATTAATTTTTAPILVHSALDADWINDEFGPPDSEMEEGRVLASVFARAGDSSQFLQASREEIALAVPDVQFPATLPVQVTHVTSQLVIESRELVLADDPTVAFGLWSVEPYTRSRSVGQTAILNASRDPAGVELAAAGNLEDVCSSLVTGERVCSSEDFTTRPVWRLEDGGGVIHVWYADPFRYELQGLRGFDEALVHEMVDSVTPLRELLPEAE